MPAFSRSAHDRIVTGVAGGLADRAGIDPVFVRAAFVVLASAGGFGIVAYAFAWLLSVEPAGGPPARPVRRTPAPDPRQTLAFLLVMLGALVLLREIGLWFGDAVTWPLALAVVGSTLIWGRGDAGDRARWQRLARYLPSDPVAELTDGPVSPTRLVAGALLVFVGMTAFLAANRALTFAAIGPVVLAVVVTVAGLGLIGGPWLTRMTRQLREERRERIRSEERAEMAAHLHDSVLQTLALIQRAEVPGDVRSLARRQERELRGWLYGGGRDPGLLGASFESAAADVEGAYGVPIDVVVVGDAPLDDRLHALVQASREAMSNAARHSAAELVSVYVEVEPHQVSAFVTDHGKGFDPQAVPQGRLGIAESIRGRIQRHGGRADVVSTLGEGTEVALSVPRGTP